MASRQTPGEIVIRDLFTGEIVSPPGAGGATVKVVGQHVRLAVEGAFPEGAAIRWRIPRNDTDGAPGAVEGYSVRSPTARCERAAVSPLTDAALRRPVIEFYWTDAVAGAVAVSVTAPDTTVFTTSAAFEVKRPTCSEFQLHAAGAEAITSGTDGDGRFFLRYGAPRHSPGPRGLSFSVTASAPAEFAGRFGVVQTVRAVRGETVQLGTHLRRREWDDSARPGGFALDRPEGTTPFLDDATPFAVAGETVFLAGSCSPTRVGDAAGQGLRYDADEQYRGALLFQPHRQNEGEQNVFVTLREYEWAWRGDVERPATDAPWPTIPNREAPAPAERNSVRLPVWEGRAGEECDPAGWATVDSRPGPFGAG
ncbi:hypothetical protein [Alienimonas californiensis]|uniref:Uncharacterized protein n=1 Tax=Alienimonas californiensis TaxID=2527989 RepID=A0A517P4D7_9PLAN|nr:hypothetical protein [Alienimonas californiensis]QDT14240.1 hypothetical protein CA12_03090 [Alienimonas californiensis]